MRFRPDPRLFPFESNWFRSSAGKVHYLDEGDGPPILFLHGNPTWSFLYRGIIIRLRKSFRCIAPDYLGFGLSDHPPEFRYGPQDHVRAMGELIRHLGLEGLTIMGHDWGGPIGLKVALDHRDRMRALAMANTWYWPTEALHLRTFGWLFSTGYMQGLIHRRNLFVERIIPLGVKEPMAPEVLDHYRGPFPTPDSRAGVAELARQVNRADPWLAELEYQVREGLGHLPLLLTWGMEDLAFTPSFMDLFFKDFPMTRVVRLDARHFVQEDRPAQVSSALADFLKA